MPSCKPVPNLYLYTWPRTNNARTRLLSRERIRKIIFFASLEMFSFGNCIQFRECFHFFFFIESHLDLADVGEKCEKLWVEEWNWEVSRCLSIYNIYRVQHIVDKGRESMAFDFQALGTRHENLCLLFTNRWRGETWIYVFSFIPSRGVYFSILSGDAEAYGRATNFYKGMLISI